MDGLTMLRQARRVGLEVLQDRDRLVVRGPRRLEQVALRVLAHKPEVLRALEAEQSSGVAWRMAAMRAMLPARGPLPLLLARPDRLGGPGRCCSCGDALSQGDHYRCRPCFDAVVRVLEALP